MQTLKEIVKAISNVDGMNNKDAMEMEVEFNTLDRDGLSLLSVYEYGGKIIIDVGTTADDEQNVWNSGY